MNRKEFIRNLSLAVAGTTLLGEKAFAAPKPEQMALPENAEKFSPIDMNLEASVEKPITVLVIGAGGRGNAYSRYSKQFPNCMKIVGAADLQPQRRAKMENDYYVPKENLFSSWEEALSRPKFADAVIISTPDDVHYAPCMKAIEAGYDVLLEKPIAPTEQECRNILAQAKKYNKIVAVCHVLRYAPYFVALKKAVESGAIGKIVSVQHLEPILFDHMAHSYVRGIWRNSKTSTPIILAKSCHDLDIVRWLVNEPCQTIAADGSLSLFRKENAPEGAPKRCTDGCPHEKTCAFSAINIYVRRRRMLYVFDLPTVNDEAILEKLRTTNYGKCVYHSDNDQCDHYTTTINFNNNITAALSMEAFTSYSGRRTRIFGTKGDIVGDMEQFIITDFLTNKKIVWNEKVKELDGYKGVGHGGGDWALVRDFINAVGHQKPELLSSSIDVSVESHIMGFKAEQSRVKGKKVTMKNK